MSAPLTREDLAKMTPSEITRAQEAGKLTHLGIGSASDQWGFSTPGDPPTVTPYVREDGGKLTMDDLNHMTQLQRSRAYVNGDLDHLKLEGDL